MLRAAPDSAAAAPARRAAPDRDAVAPRLAGARPPPVPPGGSREVADSADPTYATAKRNASSNEMWFETLAVEYRTGILSLHSLRGNLPDGLLARHSGFP